MENHLRLRREGRLEQDLEENYHPHVVVLSPRAAYHGHQGVRESAHLLWGAVPDAGAYIYDRVLVTDGFAMLEWRARTDEFYVSDGVDSYVIEDGLLVGQTIHYRVQDLKLSVTADALVPPQWPGQVRLSDAAELVRLNEPQGRGVGRVGPPVLSARNGTGTVDSRSAKKPRRRVSLGPR